MGYTHFDTAETYASGHGEELLGRAIRESRLDRQRLFITSKVSPSHLRYRDVLNSCESSLRRLGTAYVDLYLIHWPGARMRLEETFQALNQLVQEGKVNHLGVSNFDLKLLQESQRLSESPILTDQVPYSVQDRSYAGNGVLKYCQDHEILLTAYSPLEQGSLRVGKAVASLAKARSATTSQIALAWLCNQSRVITIPMSSDREHQRENLEAADLSLTPAEMELLG